MLEHQGAGVLAVANKDEARDVIGRIREARPQLAADVDLRLASQRAGTAREQQRVRRILAADKVNVERKAGPSRRMRVKMVVPTEERLAKGDQVEWVNPAEIDSAEQPIGLTRRFKSSHLDRLHRNGRLTWTQWYAGDWYRNQHARCSFALSVVASYQARTSASEVNYGLPRTEAQARARRLFMDARRAFPPHMIGFMERLLLHDDLPRYGGRAAMRNIGQIAQALDRLATWLKLA